MTYQEELKVLKSGLDHIHIMVMGDVMIDRYMVGSASRISPEAPVPVILWKSTEDKLGGASNVAANLKAMGCKVSMIGLCGDDPDSVVLEKLLDNIGCDHVHLIKDDTRPTTVKTRIVSGLHQIARLDHESEEELDQAHQEKGLEIIRNIFEKDKVDVLILQDYNKGFLHGGWIQKIIDLAKTFKVKIAVDPKRHHFFSYREVELFKPNLKEALQVLEYSNRSVTNLNTVSKILKDRLLCKKLMITLASEGIWIDSDSMQQQFLTRPRKVADVSGAGDTVISLAAICLACALSDVFMATCCNIGGGQVCEKFGVVPVVKEELIRELED